MLGLASLFAYKAFELKVKRIHPIADLFHKGDLKIHAIMERIVYEFNHTKKVVAIFVGEFLPAYTYETLSKTKDYVSKKYYATGDEFRGKRMLRSNGSVSFFLERLAEEKAQITPEEI